MRLTVVKDGFTLIELLVAISMIALLVGILLPTFAKVRQVAIKTVCSSNLRQVGIGIMTYREDHRDVFPVARYMPEPFISSFLEDPPLFDAIDQHLPENSKVYQCGGDDNYVYAIARMSYTYNVSLAGRTLEESWFARRLNFNVSKIPIAYDCDGNTFVLQGGQQINVPSFHTLRNLLFADGHVGNFK